MMADRYNKAPHPDAARYNLSKPFKAAAHQGLTACLATSPNAGRIKIILVLSANPLTSHVIAGNLTQSRASLNTSAITDAINEQ